MANSADTSDELVYLPLGGAGEIGMNLYLYGWGMPHSRRWLMVDLGVTFPGEYEPGVDIIMPETRFIERERERLVGIVLTHAHEDHFGAVLDLWPELGVPIHATPFTAALLKAKLSEVPKSAQLPIREIGLGARFELGPFDLELVTMAHSIPEPNALVIRTPIGMVVHTGDWKLDPTPVVGKPSDEARLKMLGEEGVEALICDSTNVFRDGVSPSEGDVGQSIADIIAYAKYRVAVTTFASNVARVLSVARATRKAGRRLVVVGRALLRVIEVARETGQLPPDFRYLEYDEFGYLPREEVVLLCTGSQGESRAALARIAEEQHPHIDLASGDMVIFSSRTIPGNEKAVARVQNALAGQGVQLVTDSEALVHVTGHPRRGELKQIYEWCRPKAVIPMHGEVRHLQEHARFAREHGVGSTLAPRNGDVVRLLPGPPGVVDQVPVGRVYRDGDFIIEERDKSVRERRKLAYAGLVLVALVLSEKGEILVDPEVTLDGVPREDEHGRALDDIVRAGIVGALNSIPRVRRKDPEIVREAARRAGRAALGQVWGKRPICKVLVSVV